MSSYSRSADDMSSRLTNTHRIGPSTTDQTIASSSGDEQGNIVYTVPQWTSEGESLRAPARNDSTADPFGATASDEDEEDNTYEVVDQGPTSAAAANYDVERPQTPRGRLDSLRRELWAIHIFMIAISAVIGIGYYVKTGIILRIGGQGAVVYSYLFLGALTLMIMRNLTVMLRVWPITGALAVFVEEFVDKEMGRVVSLLYWLTFCFSYAGLTTAIGGLVDSLSVSTEASVTISVFSLIIPIVINLTDISVFRHIELGLGVFKLSLVVSIIILMNVINPIAGAHASEKQHNATISARDAIFQNKEDLTGGWFTAIAASVYIASFSYVGVEIVAGTAQEAKFVDSKAKPSTSGGILDAPPDGERPSNELKDPFAFSLWVPIVTTAIYVWGGWIVSENIYWNDTRLPASVWSGRNKTSEGESRSIFVIANKDLGLEDSKITSNALTSFLIIHVLSTSTSSLYVASRTLFGLAYTTVKSRGNTERTHSSKLLDILVRKSKFDVPYVAILASAWLCWLPLIKYGSGATFLDVSEFFTQLSAVCCVTVWACESLAAFRFYRCFRKHFSREGMPAYIKKVVKVDQRGWYFLHLAMSGLSVVLCVLIITLGGAMMIVLNRPGLQAAASFTAVVLFVALTCFFKWHGRGGLWYQGWLTDLEDEASVASHFQAMKNHMKHNHEVHEVQKRSIWDFGGIIDSEWIKNQVYKLLKE